MAAKPVPYRCIWCLKKPPSATFKTKSHVLPESIGNIEQQVLPPGVVCDGCNKFFGHDLEPNLIDEPVLSALVGILELRDIGSEFTYKHSPLGIRRIAHVQADISSNRISLTTQYEIEGQPDKPNELRVISKSKNYDNRALKFLSRAIHKIAFETVAHNLFVGTGLQYQKKELYDIDIFDNDFDVIRDWVRYGKPQNSVRPAVRTQEFDKVQTPKELAGWGGATHCSHKKIYYALNLFNDWYILSLTSSPNEVENDLRSGLNTKRFRNPAWMVSDKLQRID
jgi:hypothetical protein